MLPGNGIGDTDKSCYTTDTQYAFQHTGLNTSDIKEYIRNPHKFNTNGKMDGVYYNLWSTDNDKTVPNDDVVIKSVYDPSPVGYSLPAPNAFTGFTTTGQNAGDWKTPGNPDHFNAKLPFDNGWYFYTKKNKQGETNFFPATGCRYYSSGFVRSNSLSGSYWNADITGEKRGRILFFLNNRIDSKSDDLKSWAFPVRSAEEK